LPDPEYGILRDDTLDRSYSRSRTNFRDGVGRVTHILIQEESEWRPAKDAQGNEVTSDCQVGEHEEQVKYRVNHSGDIIVLERSHFLLHLPNPPVAAEISSTFFDGFAYDATTRRAEIKANTQRVKKLRQELKEFCAEMHPPNVQFVPAGFTPGKKSGGKKKLGGGHRHRKPIQQGGAVKPKTGKSSGEPQVGTAFVQGVNVAHGKRKASPSPLQDAPGKKKARLIHL